MAFVEFMRRLSSLVRRDRIEEGLAAEMQFHIDQQTAKNIAAGMDAATARRAAEKRFGGVDLMKEKTRDEFRPAVMEDTLRDLAYGVRTLLRAPGFALISIITMGLGIAAATAVFTVVNGVLLKPLPYPQPERIVRLFEVDKGNPNSLSDANFQDLHKQSHAFSGMAEMAMYGDESVLSGAESSRARARYVSKDFFDVMGKKPVLGRLFQPEDQTLSAAPTAIVSEKYWRSALNGAPITGRTVRFEQKVYQVIGVMPEGFDYPEHTDIWAPSELIESPTSRTAHNFRAIARIKDGTTFEAASRDVSAVAKQIKAAYPDDNWMEDAQIVSLRDNLTSSARPVLFVLLGAAAFLLLISCANVSSLLLARAATRRRELSVRLALGAGRIAVVRQMMAESLVMCIAGGALGVALASWGVKLLLAHDTGGLPRVSEIHLDAQAIAFASGISLLTAVALGLATSSRQGHRDLRSLISNDGRTLTGGVNSQRVRDLLVVAQVALTIVLLMAAGLLTRSFVKVLQIKPGFDTSNALVMDMSLAWPRDSTAAQHQIQFQTTLLERLQTLPGVKTVAITNAFPLGGGNYSNGQFLEMNTADEFQKYEDMKKMLPAELKQRSGDAGLRIVSDRYFDAMSIPVIKGRGFDASDVTGGPEVAVISESLAKSKWPDRDPLGRYIQFGNMDGDMHGLRVVGIVADIREYGPEADPEPLIYANYKQRPGKMAGFSAVVRGPDPASISLEAQKIVHDLDPQLPVFTRTVQDAVDATFSGRRFTLMMVGIFSAVAFALATLGLYGVVSYLVAQRTREIGIRSVLGAPARTLMSLVIAKAARLALLGTITGAIGAAVFAKLLKGLLFGGVSATDFAAMFGVLATISISVLLATALPVRRALSISPMTALRDE